MTDYSRVLVKSSSGPRPHFVEKSGNAVYRCDKDCLMFKSTNGICSHSLLVATLNCQQDAFVHQYAKTKLPVNYAKLGQHELPVGGKKPKSKRKASSKKTTSAIKKILASADQIECTKRAKTQSQRITKTTPPTSQYPFCTAESPFTPPSTIYGVHAPFSKIGNVSGTVHLIPRPPPPLVHQSPGSSSSVGQPFCVMFLNARISRCQGCRGQIEQGCPSPHDIVLQHKEHVLFQNPNTGGLAVIKRSEKHILLPRHDDMYFP